jgi:N-acetylneuraminic acid mutarotase
MAESYRRTSRHAVLAALFALTCASTLHAQGTWTTLAPVLPAPVEGAQGSGTGNINVDLYGHTNIDTNLTRRYNISQNTWTLGTPGPPPIRAEIGYGDNAHGGFVYVIGGRSVSGVINNNDRYDPATDTWQSLASMPTARAAAATAVLDNSIYAIGGRLIGGGPCSGFEVDAVERYDIDTDTWSTVASFPFPASDMAAMSHGGKIYVFGGCVSGGATNAVHVYDPRTDTWTPLTPMLTPRGSLVAGIVGQVIYAIGGITGTTKLSVNEAYNIAKDSWSKATSMPTARSEAAVRSHGGRIYVYGGGGFGIETNANEVFKP